MPPLSRAAVAEIARHAPRGAGCPVCASLRCPGWEPMPAGFDAQGLRLLGTLREGDDEPTWDEYHPDGSRLWSVDAPIALGFHPYNRCDLAACSGSGRAFLRYTEYGGYYFDPRIRDLDPLLLVTDAPLHP